MSEEIAGNYQVDIGLEVHAQLLTKSKMFAPEASAYGSRPNTNVSTVSLAHPGSMPRVNKQAIEFAVKMGLACQSQIARFLYFDRKNYFYPDLPKGYQLTQDNTPLCKGGKVQIRSGEGFKEITLNRIHLEEDAGKSIHLAEETDTLVDFNRAGTPLIEIVTEPVITSGEDAAAFLAEVRKLVRFLEIGDGNMEEGSLRCDVNISVRKRGNNILGKKVEIKNLNSFANVRRAVAYETDRQINLLEIGEKVVSETRTFDPGLGTTAGMRTKEELNDYRYFPEPDLSPLRISDNWLATIKGTMPALPGNLYRKFTEEFELTDYDAAQLSETKELATYYQEVCSRTSNYKAAANWLLGPVKKYLNANCLEIENFSLQPYKLAELIDLVSTDQLSFSLSSKKLLPKLLEQPEADVLDLAHKNGLLQQADATDIKPIIKEVLQARPDKVAAYKQGKKNLLAMFMGEVLKRGKGKFDPKKVNQLLRETLEA
jgi:aspartyl-tRNA(Asn)/glutamyl-tRNA(Gln) amidotransferase subunit B